MSTSSSLSSVDLRYSLRSKLVAPLRIVPSEEATALESLSKRGLRVSGILEADTDESFVCKAMEVLFQRPASSACIEHYAQFLRSKTLTRAQILFALAESPEGSRSNVQLIGLTAQISEDLAAIQSAKVLKSVWRSVKDFWRGIQLVGFFQRVFHEYSAAHDEKILAQQNRMVKAVQELHDQLMQAESRIADLERRSEQFTCRKSA